MPWHKANLRQRRRKGAGEGGRHFKLYQFPIFELNFSCEKAPPNSFERSRTRYVFTLKRGSWFFFFSSFLFNPVKFFKGVFLFLKEVEVSVGIKGGVFFSRGKKDS